MSGSYFIPKLKEIIRILNKEEQILEACMQI